MNKIPKGYKQTEVGVIPEDWDVKLLGTFGTFSKGKGIKKDEVIPDGIPCIRYGEIYTTHSDYIRKFHSFISENIANQSKKIKTGDLLFAGSGETSEEIGKCVAYLGNMVAFAGGDIVIFSPQSGKSKFLGYLLNHSTIVRQKSQMGQGDAVVHISGNNLASLKIPLPKSETEQSAIAEALSDVDALISSLDELIAKKRNIKQGAMQELLTGKRRLPGFSGKWKIKKLAEIVEFSNGKAHEKYISDDGKFIVINSKYISSEGKVFKFSDVCLCPASIGDILMVMSDVPNGKAIAKCFIVDKNNFYTVNQRICSLKSEVVDLKFLFYKANRNQYYLAFDDGSKQTNLKKNDVLNCEISMPNEREEQSAIAAVLSDMDAEIEQLERKRDKYKQVKQGMMQELLTGKIRLIKD